LRLPLHRLTPARHRRAIVSFTKNGITNYRLIIISTYTSSNTPDEITEYDIPESELTRIADRNLCPVNFNDINQARNWFINHFRFDNDPLTNFFAMNFNGQSNFRELNNVKVRNIYAFPTRTTPVQHAIQRLKTLTGANFTREETKADWKVEDKGLDNDDDVKTPPLSSMFYFRKKWGFEGFQEPTVGAAITDPNIKTTEGELIRAILKANEDAGLNVPHAFVPATIEDRKFLFTIGERGIHLIDIDQNNGFYMRHYETPTALAHLKNTFNRNGKKLIPESIGTDSSQADLQTFVRYFLMADSYISRGNHSKPYGLTATGGKDGRTPAALFKR
jgi:hypothetical protein